jgi:choline dehydrogenase-like flavoprotein
VGHYLTYHTHANAELTFKDRPVWDFGPGYQPRTGIGSLQLRDLYVIRDPARPDLAKAGKFSIYDRYTCYPPIMTTKQASMGRGKAPAWGQELMQYLQELRSQGGVYFSYTGEAMSTYDNRVELDPEVKDPWGMPAARTYYRHHKYDMETCDYALTKVCQIMVDAGGEVRKYDSQKEDNEGYGHVHGTLRAGTDPEKSVLDAECQSHTVKGLHVLDSAFMPTAGASNPSITLIANAYRVCERVQKQ